MQSCWRSPNATACSGEPADGSGTSKEEKELDEHENQLADEVLELEERTEEILLRQYKFTSRKLELTTEVKIEHSCCKKLAAQLKPAKIELGRIYEACTNPVARYCAMLEMGIALYGPLSLVTMSVLFCSEIEDDMGNTVAVLVVDSSQRCDTDEHTRAYYFAWIFLLLLTVGLPLVMLYAAIEFNNAIDEDSGSLRRKAKELAKARFHSSWKHLKKKEKNKWIEACEHELKLTVMGAHSFLLTSFQMSVRANVSTWYPQWHLVRRTFLNILYFEGMRTGTGQVGFWGYQADWRVVVVVLLAISNLIQAFYKVFRDPEVRRLTHPCVCHVALK